MKLSGKRALVTGASRGIGEGIARRLAAAGADVAVVARSTGALEKVAADTGGHAYEADLSDPTQVAGLIARVERDGPIDLLVNNAGVDHTGRLVDMPDGQVAGMVQLNLAAPIDLCRQVIPGMVDRGGGHIVNVSSLAASFTVPGLAVYSATKSGLCHFTGALRSELKGLPVATTLVELGPTLTEMWDNVTTHAPTARAIHRFEQLRLVTYMDAGDVAGQIVSAIVRRRRHLRLPHRDLLLPLLAESPRAITAALLTGVDAQ